MWSFNLNRVIRFLLPPDKRSVKRLAWLSVSISYLMMILEQLRELHTLSIKEAKMTPQIAYLEHYLNERYGTGTAIFISDGFLIGPWIFSNTEIATPEFYMDLADSFVYSQSDQTSVDFIVNIPHDLTDFVQDIAATVEKFKLFGKYFIIQIIV